MLSVSYPVPILFGSLERHVQIFHQDPLLVKQVAIYLDKYLLLNFRQLSFCLTSIHGFIGILLLNSWQLENLANLQNFELG